MNTCYRMIAPVLALLIPVAAAVAQDASDPPAAPTMTIKDPVQQIPHTLKALESAKAGEYGKLRSDNKHRLDAADREIQSLMQGNSDLHTLDERERTRLFNAQETILTIVSDLKRSQLVCTYRQNVGTRFRTKHCVTRDMAEAQRRAAQDATHALQNPMCVPGEGNPCSR